MIQRIGLLKTRFSDPPIRPYVVRKDEALARAAVGVLLTLHASIIFTLYSNLLSVAIASVIATVGVSLLRTAYSRKCYATRAFFLFVRSALSS